MKKNRKKFRSPGRAVKILPRGEYAWENGAVGAPFPEPRLVPPWKPGFMAPDPFSGKFPDFFFFKG